MAQSIAKLVIDLEANFAKFTSQFEQLQAKVNRGTASITSSFKKIAALTIGSATVVKFTRDLEALANQAKQIEKQTIKLSIDSRDLTALHEAAEEYGVSSESVNKSLQIFQKNISIAASGIEQMTVDEDGVILKTNKFADALSELGISANKLKELPIIDQFKIFALRISEVENAADRMRLTLALMGKGGGDMLAMMAEGVGPVIVKMEEAKKQGIAWSNVQVAKGAEAWEAIDRLGDAWSVLKRKILDISPPLVSLFTLWAKGMTGVISLMEWAGNKMDGIANRIKNATLNAAQFMAGVHTGDFDFEPIKEEVGGLPPALEKRLRGILEAGRKQKELEDQLENVLTDKIKPQKKEKGGAAGGVDSFEQLAKTLDSLKTEKLSLVGTEFQKIDDWVRKTMEDIQQWGDLGELTAEAVATTMSIAAEKKKAVETDFLKWVTEQTGDYVTSIGVQIDELAKKWGNLPGAMQAFEAFRVKEEAKKGSEYEQSRLNLTKQFLDELSNTAPLLSDQLRIKEQTLAIDIQIGRERLKLLQFEPWMTDELWKQSNALAAQVEKSKELALAREKLMTQGAWGGMQAWAIQRQQEAEIRPAQMMVDTMRALEQEMAAGFADAIVGALKGKQTDMSQIFFSIAESGLRRAITGLTATLFDQFAGLFGTTKIAKPDGTPLNPFYVVLQGGMAGISPFGGGGGGSYGFGGWNYSSPYPDIGAEGAWGMAGMADYYNELGVSVEGFYSQQTSAWQSLTGASGGWLGQLFNTVGSWFSSLTGAFGGGGGGGFGLSGLGGLLGGLFGGGGGSPISGLSSFTTAGFVGGWSLQHGGQFTVPGTGGPDSKTVFFRATPGEQVTVTPTGESGGRININVHQTFVTQDPASFKASRTQLAAQAATDLQRSMRNL